MLIITEIGGFIGVVQSICHPFATAIFKIITEQRKGSEHAEQLADSLPVFLFMTFLLVLFFQRDQQNVQPSFQYHARRSAMLACKRYQRYFDCMKDIVKNDAT